MTLPDQIDMLKVYADKINEYQRDLDWNLQQATNVFALDERRARDEAFELAEQIIQLRRAHDVAKSVTSQYNKISDQLEARMNALMAVAELPNLPRKDYKIIPTNKLRISASGGIADPALREWLISNDLGNLVEPKVNANQLSSAIKEHVAGLTGKEKSQVTSSDIPDDLKALLNVSDVASIQVNKA